MILPIDDRTPACFGVVCPQHGTCERYALVDHTSPDHTIATCDDGQGGRPLYLQRHAEAAHQ